MKILYISAVPSHIALAIDYINKQLKIKTHIKRYFNKYSELSKKTISKISTWNTLSLVVVSSEY